MAIRYIAHAIQSREISLGIAIGVENMTLKYVRLFYAFLSGTNCIPANSPRPTPLISEEVDQNPQAHDCIQVFHIVVVIRVFTRNVIAHGVDL